MSLVAVEELKLINLVSAGQFWTARLFKTFLNSSYELWKVVGAGKKGNVINFFFFFLTVTRTVFLLHIAS